MKHKITFIIALLATALLAPMAQAAFVSGSTLNCRAEPSPDAEILERLVRGQEVTILESQDGWGKAQLSDSKSCWVSQMFLSDFKIKPEETKFVGAETRTDGFEDSIEAAVSKPKSKARSKSKSRSAATSRRSTSRPASFSRPSVGGSCPCDQSKVCVGPRGGRYCFNSTGTKRYGV
jgi:uncharacterized protein YgiM (DUF1202 family)